MGMKKIISYFIIVCAFMTTGCSRKKAPQANDQMVKTSIVQTHGEEFDIVYPGKTIASSDVSLSFRIAGPIKKYNVKEGQKVRKGDVIVEMDPRDYQIQLAATEAEYKKIKAEAERIIELYNRNSATANDYDKARYGLEQITKKYESHKNALNDTRLTAPFDGYIQKRIFSDGETVGAGMPVISMVANNNLEVEINLPASDYQRKEQFKDFYCIGDNSTGCVYPLELIGITRKANLNQLYSTRFRLKNADNTKDLTAGMSVNVKIEYIIPQTTLVSIPLQSVFEKDGESAVWVVTNDNTVESRIIKPVQILKNGQMVVSNGIGRGETIVSAGVHKRKEGMKVRILPSPSKTNIGGLL